MHFLNAPSRSKILLFLIIGGISFTVRYPLLMNRTLPNDYDQPSQTINYMKTDRRYVPDRHPGCPLYDMGMGIAYHKIVAPLFGLTEMRDHARYGIDILSNENDRRIYTDSAFLVVFKMFSFVCGLIVLALMHEELAGVVLPTVAFLACLACLLHPDFIWMSVAWSEDIVAMALAWMCLAWARRDTHGWGTAVLGALAVGVKFTSVVLVIAAALRFAGRYSDAWDRKRFKNVAKVLGISGGLSLLFYMPAFIYFKMDVTHMLDSPSFGLSAGQRVWTGLQILRSSLPYWIPLVFVYAVKRKAWKAEDSWWAAFTILGFLAVQPPGWRGVLAVILAAGLIGWALLLTLRHLRSLTPEDMVHPFIVLSGMAIIFSEPFSRSYVLLFLPSLLILLARRFSSTLFWLTVVILTYLPMFYFYILDPGAPRLAIYQDGFYACFLDAKRTRWNDINDFGYKTDHIPAILLGRS